MIAYLLLRLALLIVAIAAIRRIWGASALHAILSMFIPFYVFVPMVKYWNDPDHDVRWHVALMVVGGVATFWLANHLAHEYQAELLALQAQQQQFAAVDEDGSAESDDGAPANADTSTASPNIEIGPVAMFNRRREPAGGAGKSNRRAPKRPRWRHSRYRFLPARPHAARSPYPKCR